MSKYLKLFETTSDYEAYINGEGVVLPNVSVAKDAPKTVYYNPWVEPFFAKLSLDNGEVVELQGSGAITESMVKPYKSSVVSAEIGKSCTTIGNSAFSSCKGLTSVTIPDSVTSIGYLAFSSCTSLTNIVVDSANTVFDSRDNCNAIINTSTNELILGCKNTVIPNTVTSIGEAAFNSCTGLTSVTIPDSVTSIGYLAFSSCTSLTNIVVDSANTVYDSRDNCNAIIKRSTNELIVGCKNTVIPDSVTSIGNSAFNWCTGLTSITIPNGVTSIGNSAFNWCTGLTSITIPNGVTSIGNYAFNFCTGLTSVTIGNGVTSIGNSAFNWCTGLTSITIPNGVTSIGNSAFNWCTGLTSVTSLATTAPTIQSGTFTAVKTGGTLTVPSGSTGYDVWMGTGDYYLGNYGWTKVEQ